jgi:hypothetical protein
LQQRVVKIIEEYLNPYFLELKPEDGKLNLQPSAYFNQLIPDFLILKLYKWLLKLISEAATGGDFFSFMRETASDARLVLKF